MAGDSAVRRKAGFAVARSLADPKTRELFLRNGYTSDQEIVVALEGDTIEEVFQRIRKHTPPVTVAIYWPEAARIEYTSFTPGEESALRTLEEIGGTATIGMLYERVDQESRSMLRFKLAWNATVGMQVAPYETALT